ncbi:hypothetical protein ES703_66588 [subsurface metagenome]
MALGADNAEPAQLNDLLVGLLPLLLLFALGVAPQNDIDAAPGHIGSHRYRPRLPRLGDDVSLFLMPLWIRVKHLMGDAPLG